MAAESSTSPSKETVTFRLPSGEEIDAIIPGGLSDADAKSYVQMKRPDLLGPPVSGIKPPPDPVKEAVKDQQLAPSAGLPGGSSIPAPANDGMLAGGILGLGAAATAIHGPAALGLAAKHPIISSMLIGEARKIPYVGKYIPPYSELLPMLLRGGGEAEPEPASTRPPPVTYSNRTPAEPEISNTPPPPLKWPNRIEEEAAPRQAAPPPVTYSNRIAPKAETIESAPAPAAPAASNSIQSPIEATPTAKPKGTLTNLQQQIKDAAEPAAKQTPRAPVTDLQQQLNDALGGKVPEGHTPIKSSALTSYKNNPAAREFEAVTKTGQHYVYGDVPPEAAAKFESATSKGKAWNELRKTPGVTQVAVVVNGQRMPTKPPVALQSASPDDVSPEWQKNVDYLKAKKAAKGTPPN